MLSWLTAFGLLYEHNADKKGVPRLTFIIKLSFFGKHIGFNLFLKDQRCLAVANSSQKTLTICQGNTATSLNSDMSSIS